MPKIFLNKNGVLMPKVLISDKLNQKAVDIFAAHEFETDVKTGLTPQEMQYIVVLYHGLAIRSATKVTETLPAAATN